MPAAPAPTAPEPIPAVSATPAPPACRTRLVVEEPAEAAPIIPLPLDRAEEVSRVLDEAGVRHWVQLPYPSFFGGPPKTDLLLTYAADVDAVQRLLDEAFPT